MTREAQAPWVAKAIEAGRIPEEWADMVAREIIERYAHEHAVTDEQARAILTGEKRPAPGTLWLDPTTGNTYRLRDYHTDWMAEPFTGDATAPTYTWSLVGGGTTTLYNQLPDHLVLIWSPEEGEVARAAAWQEGVAALAAYQSGGRKKAPYPTNPYRKASE